MLDRLQNELGFQKAVRPATSIVPALEWAIAELTHLTADRERLRAALLDIGNLAATSVDDEFLRGVVLRDIIYRCADAIDPELAAKTMAEMLSDEQKVSKP